MRPPPSTTAQGACHHGGAAAKAAVESSLAHPKVGQPVTFTAKVSLPAGPVRPIEEPRFVINGPGLTPDTKLGAIPQPGALYATNFAGSLPGKYEVTFDARVDGLAVRATKAFVIEGGAPAPSSSAVPPLPPPSTSTAPPVPSTVPSGKWL